MDGELRISPMPGRLVIRPFDPQENALIYIPDTVSMGSITTGIVVAVHHGANSTLTVDEHTEEDVYFINVGDQVIFPAMSGTEVKLPEPKPDNKRHTQKYILIREQDVVAKMDTNVPLPDVVAEPRSYGN